MDYVPQVADILEWNGRNRPVYLMVLEVNKDTASFTAYNFTTQRINNEAWSYDYEQYSQYGYFRLVG